MLKFLRQYRAIILAVGGSLLMVAFLLPQAIQTWAQMSFDPIDATLVVDGVTRDVDTDDWMLAEKEINVLRSDALGGFLERLFYPEGRPLTEEQQRDPFASRARPEPVVDDAGHWYLLRLEAERMGLIGAPEEGRLFITSLFGGDSAAADELMWQIAGTVSTQNRPLTLDDVYESIGAYLGVARMVEAYRSMGLISEPRLMNLANAFNEAVDTRILFLRADQFVEEMPEPTEEELQAHLEQFAAYAPGEGPYGIGYQQPDRFKVEYLAVDYDSVLDSVDADGLKARTWYLQNEPLIRELAGDGTTPADAAPPYNEHIADALLLYRRHLADQKLEEIIRTISGDLLRSTSGLPREDSYRVLPPDWAERRVQFEALAASVESKFPGVEVAVTPPTDTWLTEGEIFSLPGLNRASRMAGNRAIGFRDLVRSAREFGRPTIPGVQAGLTDPQPLRGNASVTVFDRTIPVTEDVFFYRITEIDPKRPAQSVDEVRASAVENVKRINAFEQLAREANVWRQRAIDEGLDAIAEGLSRRPTIAQARRYDSTTYRFTRELQPTRLPGPGADETLNQAIFDVAADLEARVRDAGENATIADLPLADRLVVMPIEDALGLALIEVTQVVPMTLDAYVRTVRDGLQVRMSDPRFGSFNQPVALTQVYGGTLIADEEVVQAFSYDTLRAKYNFVVTTRAPIEEEETEGEDGETGAAGVGAGGLGVDDGPGPDVGEAPGNLPTTQAPANTTGSGN